MVDDRNIGFKSRKIRRNETGIYNVFVEWWGGGGDCWNLSKTADECKALEMSKSIVLNNVIIYENLN
jgi:hypothetical protein